MTFYIGNETNVQSNNYKAIYDILIKIPMMVIFDYLMLHVQHPQYYKKLPEGTKI